MPMKIHDPRYIPGESVWGDEASDEEWYKTMGDAPFYPNRYQNQVAQFHRAFGLPDLIAKPSPFIPDDRRALRLSLIKEEGVLELFEAIIEEDVVATVDALVDLAYVVYGALVEMGQVLPDIKIAPLKRGNDNLLFSMAYATYEIAKAGVSAMRTLTKDETGTFIDYPTLNILAAYALNSIAAGGYDVDALFGEVQRSNMSKLGEDGLPIHSRGEELDNAPLGKVLKGPNFTQPDLKSIMDQR